MNKDGIRKFTWGVTDMREGAGGSRIIFFRIIDINSMV